MRVEKREFASESMSRSNENMRVAWEFMGVDVTARQRKFSSTQVNENR